MLHDLININESSGSSSDSSRWILKPRKKQYEEWSVATRNPIRMHNPNGKRSKHIRQKYQVVANGESEVIYVTLASEKTRETD